MKKYRIFPKESLCNLFIIIILLTIILVIIDRTMPQYEKWQEYDAFIKKNLKEKRKESKGKQYPLMNLPRTNIAKGEIKKILIIGDSFIEGDGYNNSNYTWWRQLQLELYERGYYDVQISAVGICGASTYDEMIWLTTTSLIEEEKPDLIIFGYVTNDPELDDEEGNCLVLRSTSTNYFKDYSILKKCFPNVVYKINNMINEKENRTKEYNEETGFPLKIWTSVIINEEWLPRYNEKAVKPLGEYLNSIDIPSFVITTPNSDDERYKEWHKVLDLFEAANIKNYDMFDDFKKMAENSKDSENKKINYVNGHPGTLYTKYYAEYVSNILEKDYKEILGTKYDEKIEYPLLVNDYMPLKINLENLSRDENRVSYRLEFPTDGNTFYLPIKKEYVKLSLEFPTKISNIKIDGEGLKDAEIYITTVNKEKGYDDQKMKYISKQKGKSEEFYIDSEDLVTSINIHANTGEDNKLVVTIEK